MTTRVHIAIAVEDYEASLHEYTERLHIKPCCTVDGMYALWRTEQLNLSIRVNPLESGVVRHLGFEDTSAAEMTAERDVNGVLWERFTAEQQRAEILQNWPDAQFHD